MKSKAYSTFIVVMLCLLSGCAGLADRTKNMEKIVYNLFADISETEYAEYETWGEKSAEHKNVAEPEWIQDRFKQYMTDSAYESVLQVLLYQIPVIAYENNKKVNIDQVQISEEEGYYSFSCGLSVAGGSGKIYSVSGSIQFEEDGNKITYLNIDNKISDLMEFILGQ